MIRWYRLFLQGRRRRNYGDKIFSCDPARHRSRMSKREIEAAARRFRRDGETANAQQLLMILAERQGHSIEKAGTG